MPKYAEMKIIIKILDMKKAIILIICLSMSFYTNAQEKTLKDVQEEFKQLISDWFFSNWLHFRMAKNPLLSYDEKYRYGQLRTSAAFLLPDNFFKDFYEAQFKISVWEDMPETVEDEKWGYYSVRSPYYFIIEKGDGITAVKSIYSFNKGNGPDTLRLNIYDSIFPYDNRFLVRYNVNNKRIEYLSGNVLWNGLKDDPFSPFNSRIIDAAFARGVQFGLREIPQREMEKTMTDSLRRLRPDFRDYVYTTANKSYLTKGKLLVGGPENKVSDYIEFIYYTIDPGKTGDSTYAWYEMRYVLPTRIESITERHWVKRKLTDEEVYILRHSYLGWFIEPYYYDDIINIEEEEEE